MAGLAPRGLDVPWLNTRREASIRPWCVRQRVLRRATSGRVCSSGSRVFFEAQPLGMDEQLGSGTRDRNGCIDQRSRAPRGALRSLHGAAPTAGLPGSRCHRGDPWWATGRSRVPWRSHRPASAAQLVGATSDDRAPGDATRLTRRVLNVGETSQTSQTSRKPRSEFSRIPEEFPEAGNSGANLHF